MGLEREMIVSAPFHRESKEGIVKIGNNIGVPFIDAYTCYNGGIVHCGKCGACNERKEAFSVAGLPDQIQYEE